MYTFEETNERLVNNIKVILQFRQMTQQQLAQCLGVDHSTLSGIMNRRANPSLKRLHQIATALKVDVAELLSENIYAEIAKMDK